MDYTGRIQKLKRSLRRKNLDAILIGQPENRRYLSGYTPRDHSISESSGYLLVCARDDDYLLTDFRYKIQAEHEVHHAQVLIYTKGVHLLLRQLALELNLKRIGFESNYILHSSAIKLIQTCSEKDITITPTTELVEKMRLIKDQDELNKIRQSVQLNEHVFQSVMPTIDADCTELDIAINIENTMRHLGAESASFDTIVAIGLNSALPHAVPGKRRLKNNQPLMVDMGLILDGYCSDMTRTFVLGKADSRYLEIHKLVRKAQTAAIKFIRPGKTMKEVDKVARSLINDGGYGQNFGHALGHGVGLAVHEKPRLSSQSGVKLREGMVVTVEPGIYISDWGGVRLENMVVITRDGCEVLNHDTTWLDL